MCWVAPCPPPRRMGRAMLSEGIPHTCHLADVRWEWSWEGQDSAALLGLPPKAESHTSGHREGKYPTQLAGTKETELCWSSRDPSQGRMEGEAMAWMPCKSQEEVSLVEFNLGSMWRLWLPLSLRAYETMSQNEIKN